MAGQQPEDTRINHRRDDGLPPDLRPLRGRASRGRPGKAAGTVTRTIFPGEAQLGNGNEQAGNLGGPVDVFPLNQGLARETSEG